MNAWRQKLFIQNPHRGYRLFTSLLDSFGAAVEYAFTPQTENVSSYTYQALYSTSSSAQTYHTLLDSVTIQCVGGSGGNGALEYIKPSVAGVVGPGKPCGGTGGRGGNVILEADYRLAGFYHIYQRFPKIRKYHNSILGVVAEQGGNGKGKNTDGVAGCDLVLRVPLGTTVFRCDGAQGACEGVSTSLKIPHLPQHQQLKWSTCKIATLLTPRQRFVVANGGTGGSGNSFQYADYSSAVVHFYASVCSNPHHFQPGKPGDSVVIRLVLNCLADIGLLGFPNAGKSTLLNAISQSRSKVGPEPFTTRDPTIGTIKYKDEIIITVADLPGIAPEGSADGELNKRLLRVYERIKVLAYIIDIVNEQIDPCDAFFALRNETEKHSGLNLASKPFVVVANKCDRYPASSLAKVLSKYPKTLVLPISSRFGDGVQRFVEAIREVVVN